MSKSRKTPLPTVRQTRRGWRISQFGTVLSEVLRKPGPTHSVFDVLAAACLLESEPRDIALLGFGGGSVVAALRALGSRAQIHAVDLDPTGWDLLRSARAAWLDPISWHQGDAGAWLQASGRFDVIVDDLSIPTRDDVEKPAATWRTFPDQVARHLRPGGLGVFNLLRPDAVGWPEATRRVLAPFARGTAVHLDDFENRIVIATKHDGNRGAGEVTRRWSARLRRSLATLRSRQRTRVRLRSVSLPT